MSLELSTAIPALIKIILEIFVPFTTSLPAFGAINLYFRSKMPIFILFFQLTPPLFTVHGDVN